MPPIINSDGSGKVETTTTNLFLDVTGFDQDMVNTSLLILCMALQDRGANVEKVKLVYNDDKTTIYTPLIDETTIEFEKQKVYDYFEKMDDEFIADLLERKGYNVKLDKKNIKATYLNYRRDIMHPVDVIEDLIISYGYNSIKPEDLTIQTTGSVLQKTEWNNIARESALGLGLQEVMLFTLSSKMKQFTNLGIKGQPVEIANPMSENIAIFREKIFPEHLEFLSSNQHISYPQNIFEVGQTLETDTKVVFEKNKICVTLCHNKVSYTEIGQMLKGFLDTIGAENVKLKAHDYNWFIKGRSAKVSFELNGKTKEGFIGEIHPQVLENFNLEMPTAVFELEIDK